MSDMKRLNIATDYFNKAYKLHSEGKLLEAINYYKMSIGFCPTAEAHTYLGWAYSMQGNFKDAIKECEIAIELDDEYGNPYNDIGNYLVNLGKYEEARIWFEKAIKAPKYQLRHLPFFNLGKVYEKKGEWFLALDYYKKALKLNPSFQPAQQAFITITTMMN
jgi:Tfp pilus assembly protein PilF